MQNERNRNRGPRTLVRDPSVPTMVLCSIVVIALMWGLSEFSQDFNAMDPR